MFYGEYEHALDAKDRVIIPAKFREVFKEQYAEKFYMTRGLDRCLFLFIEEEWRIQEKKLKLLSFTREQARAFNRLFFSGASEVTCDKQGRILIPQYLKKYAGINEQVMIIGVTNRVEIWDKNTWGNFSQKHLGSYETLAEKLLEGEGGQPA
ncbi:MAG: division/cell wall cluster transcriptional repressor MraZ [Candidatus Omnitrophica bacterium]|nr:division/cell wall cluster transcriptional repressor MraZ [Candidatus Omnitrophota bacterium]